MHRYLLTGLLVLVLLVMPRAAGAAERAAAVKTYHPADKFVRGLVNLVTAPVELPRHIRQSTRGGNTFRHWAAGTSQGLGYTVVRFVAGAYEVLTFPAPAPKDYAPVVEPEYVWEEERPR